MNVAEPAIAPLRAVRQRPPWTPTAAAVESAVDPLPGSASGRRVWRINCGDVINRDRCLTVLADRDKVVLVGPPGETAVLTASQLGQLRTALREAAEQAER